MRKVLLLLFGFTTLSIQMFAQEGNEKKKSKVKLRSSEYVKTKKLGEFVGNTDKEIYYFRLKKMALTINTFDYDLKLLESRKIKLPPRYDKLIIDSINKNGDKLIIKSRFHN